MAMWNLAYVKVGERTTSVFSRGRSRLRGMDAVIDCWRNGGGSLEHTESRTSERTSAPSWEFDLETAVSGSGMVPLRVLCSVLLRGLFVLLCAER